MQTGLKDKSESITLMLNGTLTSVKNVIPIQHNISQPELLKGPLKLEYGVLIGLTGDVKGKLVLSGNANIFGSIGQVMFGMPIGDDMLGSFSGELGNMIAGGLSTNVIENGIKADITAPTIMEGNTTLSGYEKAIQLNIQFDSIGDLAIYLLLD